jgi:hypothetical protein
MKPIGIRSESSILGVSSNAKDTTLQECNGGVDRGGAEQNVERQKREGVQTETGQRIRVCESTQLASESQEDSAKTHQGISDGSPSIEHIHAEIIPGCPDAIPEMDWKSKPGRSAIEDEASENEGELARGRRSGDADNIRQFTRAESNGRASCIHRDESVRANESEIQGRKRIGDSSSRKRRKGESYSRRFRILAAYDALPHQSNVIRKSEHLSITSKWRKNKSIFEPSGLLLNDKPGKEAESPYSATHTEEILRKTSLQERLPVSTARLPHGTLFDTTDSLISRNRRVRHPKGNPGLQAELREYRTKTVPQAIDPGDDLDNFIFFSKS